MRSLVAVLVVGSAVAVLVALFAAKAAPDDELARSITQMVERSR